MTEEEFKAVLAVEGRELFVSVQGGFASAPDQYVARVVEPIREDDTSVGPYRYPGMSRTVLEITSDVDIKTAKSLLISIYTSGSYRE